MKSTTRHVPLVLALCSLALTQCLDDPHTAPQSRYHGIDPPAVVATPPAGSPVSGVAPAPNPDASPNSFPLSSAPSNFSWVVAGKLAGLANPRFGAGLEDNLRYLYNQGIRHLVSLTITIIDTELVAATGLEHTHLPVTDFTAPTLDQIHDFVALVRERRGQGAVAVHCTAGKGRTGTMLAAWLIAEGASSSEAIATIRKLRPGSIETLSQEAMLARYAESLGHDRVPPRPDGSGPRFAPPSP